jgi:hypothetical protein
MSMNWRAARNGAAKSRKVALPDPDEFMELMARLRRKAR